jgi:phospholipase/lecithinase/hemolysin
LDTLENTIEVTIFRLDVFALFQEIVENPELFDLMNVTDPCLAGENPEFDGGTSCSNPDAFLFWDPRHPTAKVHATLAERALMAVSALTAR